MANFMRARLCFEENEDWAVWRSKSLDVLHLPSFAHVTVCILLMFHYSTLARWKSSRIIGLRCAY